MQERRIAPDLYFAFYSRVALIGAMLGASLCLSPKALASSALGVQVRVQQEFYAPLIPMTKNFRTCFSVDSTGAQVMGICTEPQQSPEPATAQTPVNPAPSQVSPAVNAPAYPARVPANSTRLSPPATPPGTAPTPSQKSQSPQRAAPLSTPLRRPPSK